MVLTQNISKAFFFWLALALLIVVFDQWSKYWAVSYLGGSNNLTLTVFLEFHLGFNSGAAFGMLSQFSGWQRWFLVAVSMLVSLFLALWLLRLDHDASVWLKLSLSLILGGALGNLIDRMVSGLVVDFIAFHIGSWYFPTFNIADTAITSGAALFIYQGIWHKTAEIEQDNNTKAEN